MQISCPHWSDCRIAGGGCCAKNYFGGKPSRAVCTQICQLGLHPPAPKSGPAPISPPIPPAPPLPILFGDLLKSALMRVGADRLAAWWTKVSGKPCNCPDRQARLNRLHTKLRDRFRKPS